MLLKLLTIILVSFKIIQLIIGLGLNNSDLGVSVVVVLVKFSGYWVICRYAFIIIVYLSLNKNRISCSCMFVCLFVVSVCFVVVLVVVVVYFPSLLLYLKPKLPCIYFMYSIENKQPELRSRWLFNILFVIFQWKMSFVS
jgi:hypothetical protein